MPWLELVPSMPTNTFRPRKKGSPQSNPPIPLPPTSLKTWLEELKRLLKLPIWNDTTPLGEPGAQVAGGAGFGYGPTMKEMKFLRDGINCKVIS